MLTEPERLVRKLIRLHPRKNHAQARKPELHACTLESLLTIAKFIAIGGLLIPIGVKMGASLFLL